MRRSILAASVVLGSALLAYAAVGNGDITATPETTVVTITSTTGSGSGTASLMNTTVNTTFNVAVGSDATCDPAMSFTVTGGNPITSFSPGTSRNVQIACPPRGSDAMRRCLYHATNSISSVALADFTGLCLYGAAPATLTPLATSLDFGTVTVGDFAQQPLTIRNDLADQTITRVYLQTTSVDGSFQLAAPCNSDAAYCDEELPAAVPPGGTFTVGIKCRPQSPGTHTAQLLVGTNTFQLMTMPVTLQCIGAATVAPALGVNPTTIEIPAPVEVMGDTAAVVVNLENAGGSTLLVTDVRIIDVDTGAAEDWSYAASGKCSGQISGTCSMGAGDDVALNVTFDPSAIGRRRAVLLVSYHDTIDRTVEIPLEATGEGATLRRLGTGLPLSFGSVPVGGMAQLPIELANDGNRDADVQLSLTATTTPPFTLAPASTTTVAPTMPRIVTLTCAPTAPGSFTTTVTIQGNDTLSMAPVNVPAECEGTTAELYANPTSIMLDEVRLGGGAITRTIQLLDDDGGAPLTFTGQPQLEATNSLITIGPLSQLATPATFDVTIMPQATGPITAAILVSTTSGETLRIPVNGSIVKASYVVAPTLDLGTFCVDQPTTSSNVALVSDGVATIELSTPTTALSPSPFEITPTQPPLYPYPLRGGGGVVVAVTPKRQQAATTVTDTLIWHTDVQGELTSPTMLTARFIDSGGAIAPPALAFGEVTVHLFTDNGQRVVIQNCNPTPLVLDPPMIQTPFSIDSPKFPAMLDPNESVAFSVGFHPTSVGMVSETLRITSPQLPGAPLEVLLIGVGGSGPAHPPDAGVGPMIREKTTFYACACNTSRPLGVVPILISLLCALRPRRRRKISESARR
jgi:hypothetical protein